jgi:hypothetical protein
MHAGSIDTERAAQGERWWSVVQAIAWIVERTPQAVERARSVRSIGRLSGRNHLLQAMMLPFL